MFKLVSLLSAIGLVVGANLASGSLEWHRFKQAHGKSYASPIEERLRHEIFLKNKLDIERFNAEQSAKLGYRRGLNHLADQTEAEVKRLLGLRLPAGFNRTNSAQSEAYLARILADKSIEVGDSVDWRQKEGVVTGVKDQGQCGSCWAFSATGVLEGQEWKHSGQSGLVDLSEQNVIDCTPSPSLSCRGGWPSGAFDQVSREGGIQGEWSYPYTARDGTGCRFNKAYSVMTVKGHAILNKGDEAQLMKVVAKYGPVSVCIDASQNGFKFYRGGVYRDAGCNPDVINHAVLVVGYGTDPWWGDYWIVKNSWGAWWGEWGYIRIGRGWNMCAIATLPAIATF